MRVVWAESLILKPECAYLRLMSDSVTFLEAVRRAVDLSRLKEEGIDFIKLARTQTANLTDKAVDGLSEGKD